MAEHAAKVLNQLTRCSTHGVSVEFDALLDSALDYFDDESDQESDIDDSSDLVGEGPVLDRLNLPENPDYESVLNELATAEQATRVEDNGDDESVSESDDGPTVIVDKDEAVLNHVADTLVHSDAVVERQRIVDFSCKCKDYEKGRCIKHFSPDYILQLRMNLNSVTDGEKEMYILGKISCTINLSGTTQCSKRKEQKERTRYRTAFMIEKKIVCRNAFKFMHW
jgi:hypothetical protein